MTRGLSSAVERRPYKARVGGSKPSAPTKHTDTHLGFLAQLVERQLDMLDVAGSNPAGPTKSAQRDFGAPEGATAAWPQATGSTPVVPSPPLDLSSAGRAPLSHGGGRRFNPDRSNQHHTVARPTTNAAWAPVRNSRPRRKPVTQGIAATRNLVRWPRLSGHAINPPQAAAWQWKGPAERRVTNVHRAGRAISDAARQPDPMKERTKGWCFIQDVLGSNPKVCAKEHWTCRSAQHIITYNWV